MRTSVVKKIASSWAARSAVLSAGGSLIDYGLLFSIVHVLGWATPVAALVGLISGATFNFVMNRRYAFAESATVPVGGQVVWYAGAMGALLLLHAWVMSYAVDRLGVPLVAAKPACDLVILGAGQLMVLRYFVFSAAPRSTTQPILSDTAVARSP